ncbi:hypothetical protein B0H13DRAFT_1887250 [Mycena leptocephala]|nr:hypothetical protein B0H13DRAFT_1887250 [Mycena leptocephala]
MEDRVPTLAPLPLNCSIETAGTIQTGSGALNIQDCVCAILRVKTWRSKLGGNGRKKEREEKRISNIWESGRNSNKVKGQRSELRPGKRKGFHSRKKKQKNPIFENAPSGSRTPDPILNYPLCGAEVDCLTWTRWCFGNQAENREGNKKHEVDIDAPSGVEPRTQSKYFDGNFKINRFGAASNIFIETASQSVPSCGCGMWRKRIGRGKGSLSNRMSAMKILAEQGNASSCKVRVKEKDRKNESESKKFGLNCNAPSGLEPRTQS